MFKRQELPRADKLLVVLSDIEMGAGGPFDDFPHSDVLAELILSYNEPPYDGLAVDLVFNGDTLDLLKTSYQDSFPRHITADVALGKLTRIAAAHPKFFEGLRRFLKHGKAARNIYFIVGNHDAEMVFPEVQRFIRSLSGNESNVHFPGLILDIGKVRLEHGNQFDPLFRVDANAPFVDFNGEQVLNISWGAAALLDTVMPLLPLLHFHDRLKPKVEVFRLMPELKELLMQLFWQYWTRDYWKGYFKSNDPTKKLNWGMVKELVRRLTSQDPEVNIGNDLEKRLTATDDHWLYVVGHMHQSCVWSHGDRKILQTGCLRNEYMIGDDGKSLRPLPKTYAEVFMRGDQPIVSQMVELESPPTAPGYIPASIFDVLPAIKEMLAAATEDAKERVEEEKREAKQQTVVD